MTDFLVLKTFLSRLATVPESEFLYLASNCKLIEVENKTLVVRQGSKTAAIYFVVKGLVRTYYSTEDKEITKGFVWEGAVAGTYSSMISQQPADFNIVAMEDCQLIAIPTEVLLGLFQRDQCWQEIGRKIAEGLLVERELRIKQMLSMNAEERYESFLLQFSEIVDRIPQYEIASYLGVTPVALSQIRSRRARGSKKSSSK